MPSITYDAEGKCTRCGSTGYYLGSYTSDSSFEDTRTCVKPCPCHGWRPVEFIGSDTACDLWSAAVGSVWLGFRRSSPAATHFRPRPQPPEVGT